MTQAMSSRISSILSSLRLTENQRERLFAEAQFEAERILAHQRTITQFPKNWRERVPVFFEDYLWHDFSLPHRQLWEWADAITMEGTPDPFVAIWPRNRGKSTTAEAVTTDIGVRAVRRYAMYCSATQEQADKHVQTIARMIENRRLKQFAPTFGQARITKNGGRVWNRQMLTTATGYTVEAIGLDRAVRGHKVDWARPDLIIFDDVDDRHDSANAVAKKMQSITQSIIPAGASNVAILFAQNLIHDRSIAWQLSKAADEDGAAQFLLNRVVSGPFPAVEGLTFERRRYAGEEGKPRFRWVITAGRSIWNGYDVQMCEDEINRVGPEAFLRESQHDVEQDNPNSLLSMQDFQDARVDAAPPLVKVAIGVDPPGGATECGIVCVGTAKHGDVTHGYTIDDASTPEGAKSSTWAEAVLACYYRNDADEIFVEGNYGGDMVITVIAQAVLRDASGEVLLSGKDVKITKVTATRGKLVRAEPVALLMQQGRAHHVGEFPQLEREWRRYVPGVSKSPNRLDAEVWAYTGLQLVKRGWARA